MLEQYGLAIIAPGFEGSTIVHYCFLLHTNLKFYCNYSYVAVLPYTMKLVNQDTWKVNNNDTCIIHTLSYSPKWCFSICTVHDLEDQDTLIICRTFMVVSIIHMWAPLQW